MASIFTRIINKELPGHIVAETDNYIAFLDIHPLAVGHTLVVPKKETDDFFDLEDDLLSGLVLVAKRVAIGICKTVPCLRVGIAVVGLEVPHAHVHLVPLHGPYDIDFRRSKIHQSQAALRSLANKLRTAVPACSPN